MESLLTYADVVRAVEDAFRADGSGRMLVPSKEVMRVGPDRANCIFAKMCIRDRIKTAAK